MTTFDELQSALMQITDSAPNESVFLENSRERERNYSRGSVSRWLEIVRILERNAPLNRCLDIGTSPLTFALKRWCGTVETLDFSEAFKPRCEQAGVRLHVGGEAWPETLLPDEYYDCIIFLEVIEHIHMNPEKVLLFLKRKLRNGGILILSTPNMMSLGNRLRMLLNRKLEHFHYPPFSDNEHAIHGHLHDRVFMPAEMKGYFQNTKWSSFSLGYHGVAVSDGMRGYSIAGRLARAPIQVIKHLVPSTRQLMLIVAKK
jgi:2-polyprenyl-3-methyl-5-hydroxy-6-metoxy-1,4-benzoquinol methylase